MSSRPITWLARARIARPTDRLDELRSFYGEGLGLPVLARFDDHAGYAGVVFGLPDEHYQLEFTQHIDGSPAPPPNPESLIALYLADRSGLRGLVERLTQLGGETVEPTNPYWTERVESVTIADPDGWRLLLVAP